MNVRDGSDGSGDGGTQADDLDALQSAIEAADGGVDQLRAIFAAAVDRYGTQEASRLWMAAFAAQDAPVTG
ncbi:MAG: hypothetical protein ACR2QK_07575 [Acidimicrobiales bacterium]